MAILPLRPGIREKQTHDYQRNGTTTLSAALEVATGLVTDRCFQQHTHLEFLAFVKQVAKAYPRVQLHVVCDNYATHKHPAVVHPDGVQPADWRTSASIPRLGTRRRRADRDRGLTP